MTKIEHLAGIIDELCRGEGSQATAIKHLYLSRSSTVDVPRSSLQNAVLCVVAQGAKSTLLYDQRFVYNPSTYLLVSLDLPLVGQLEQASAAEPFLGLSLVLDFDEIRSVMQEAKLAIQKAVPLRPGLMVGVMHDDLLDAVTRLTQLLQRPAEIAVLAPLVQREIYFRLLISEQGDLLRRMVAEGGKVQRVASGLAWLRQNLARPVRMEELAREMRMSSSGMHSWFRAVTSMSPLQFQKQLRLQEARRILLSEATDVGTVSRRVGYESASQFSREYRRFFGASPVKDIERHRTA